MVVTKGKVMGMGSFFNWVIYDTIYFLLLAVGISLSC